MLNIFIWSTITILSYKLFQYFTKKINWIKINPILGTISLVIIILLISKTSYNKYVVSTNWITSLLNPIIVMLAIPLYKNKDSLKKNYVPIIIGIVSSIIISIIAVFGLSSIMNLDHSIIISLFPKSITTPMALEVTSMLNGIKGLTVVFVVLTGIIGATFANFTLNLFKINHPIAKGIAIGASSHGIGTSKAITISEETGSASGLAMGLSGVITVISFSIISNFLL